MPRQAPGSRIGQRQNAKPNIVSRWNGQSVRWKGLGVGEGELDDSHEIWKSYMINATIVWVLLCYSIASLINGWIEVLSD